MKMRFRIKFSPGFPTLGNENLAKMKIRFRKKISPGFPTLGFKIWVLFVFKG
jgi:hypothetical protein